MCFPPGRVRIKERYRCYENQILVTDPFVFDRFSVGKQYVHSKCCGRYKLPSQTRTEMQIIECENKRITKVLDTSMQTTKAQSSRTIRINGDFQKPPLSEFSWWVTGHYTYVFLDWKAVYQALFL